MNIHRIFPQHTGFKYESLCSNCLFEICKEVKYLKLTTCENCEHYFIKNLNEHVQ
jgi:NMD protein affecting ribosome stability and mRNA decay